MENNKKEVLRNSIDTSEILNDEDFRAMNQIQAIKNYIFNILDKDKILEVLRKIVDESEIFEFKNERSKKYIDPNRPILNLLIVNKDKMEEKYNKFEPKNQEEEGKYIQNVLYGEIIKEFSNFVNDSITGNIEERKYLDKNTNIFNDDILDKLDDEEIIGLIKIFSTIFAMRINNTDKNNVWLELLY